MNTDKEVERSWALSVVLAHIDDNELARIAFGLSLSDLDRFAAVINGYRLDVEARDAARSQSATPTEEQNANGKRWNLSSLQDGG